MASGHEPNKGCVCKGRRSCLICEDVEKCNNYQNIEFSEKSTSKEELGNVYHFCNKCKRAWQTEPTDSTQHHHSGKSIEFSGVEVVTEFVSEQEESELINNIDAVEWVESQSGRRKQDYGPKVNFKKKKIKTDVFTGLPAFSQFLFNKLKDVSLLHDFIPVELCNLEYIPDRGSAIDPHFDDFWLWGERLVTLNLLSDTQYTMTNTVDNEEIQVIIPFPRRSLTILHKAARHQWKHSIKRGDICFRRVGMTIRELTPEFLPGGSQEKIGTQLIETALSFCGMSVAEYEHLKQRPDHNVNGIG